MGGYMLGQNKIIQEKIISYEDMFSNKNKGLGIYITRGSIPILLSTPHSVYQRREGKFKPKELFTGGIGKYIQEITDCHLIQSVASEFWDPNYDIESKSLYKRELLKLLKTQEIFMVIDLHGCKADTPHLVELGTIDDDYKSQNSDAELLRKIVEVFEKNLAGCEKTPVKINEKFNAARETTITNFVNTKTDIASIQIEVNADIRDFYNGDKADNSVKLVKFLEEIIWISAEHFGDV